MDLSPQVLSVRVFDENERSSRWLDITSITCKLRLQCPTGANRVWVEIRQRPNIHFAIEIPLRSGEYLNITMHTSPRLRVEHDGPYGFVLPVHESPSMGPFMHPHESDSLDLVFAIDATMSTFSSQGHKPGSDSHPIHLLTNRSLWSEYSQRLIALYEALIEHYDGENLHTAVISFGDHDISQIKRANDLAPAYLTDETELSLRPRNPAELGNILGNIHPSSGGDFVDALSTAFFAISRLRWRPIARRLVILLGDSPGYSVLRPAPDGANLTAGREELSKATKNLISRNVELVTIYQNDEGSKRAAFAERLHKYTEEQYKTLASRPAFFSRFSSLDITRLKDDIVNANSPWAYGTALGIIRNIENISSRSTEK